jgi:hypothetical protein
VVLANVRRTVEGFTYHIGLEARLVLPLQQLTPVNAVEEVVRLDLSSSLRSQTLLCVAVEEAGQKVACSRRILRYMSFVFSS